MKLTYCARNGLQVFAGVRARDDVRARLGLPYRIFAKTTFSENSTDAFGGVLLQAWYDKNDYVTGVQLYEPEARFEFRGQSILGASVREVERALQGLNAHYEFEEDGSGLKLLADGLELGLYAPDAKDDKEAKVEAVYIPIPRWMDDDAAFSTQR